MNRQIWQDLLTSESCPPWPCPACGKGVAALVKSSFKSEETVASKADQKHEDWEPEWLAYNFVAWAACTHPSCGQHLALAGTGGVMPVSDDEHGMVWQEYFVPRYCTPMPHIFAIPQRCQADVREHLIASFELFFVDKAACANRLRVALELLMEHLGMFTMVGGGRAPNLDTAIKNFTASNPVLGAQLMALKWLGNTASHRGSAGESELLDAFEILDHVLGEILERRSERVAELAKEMTARHATKKKSP